MRAKPPCKSPEGVDCPNRYIACQSNCERYAEWLAIHEAENEAIRASRNEHHEYYEYSAQVIDKQDRYKSKKRRGQR